MEHEAIVWQTQADIGGIIKRKGLNYPDEDPQVILRLSEHDLITGKDSFFPTAFSELADSLTPPFYGLVEMAFIHGEDCLPTNLQTPLFNLKALDVLRAGAPDSFSEYPVFILEVPLGLKLTSAKDFLTDSRVKVAPDGFSLLKAHHVLDSTTARATKTDQVVTLESEHEIPAFFQSGEVFYCRNDLRESFERAGISGLAFEAKLGLSAFL